MDEPISAKTTAQQSKGPSWPALRCCRSLLGSDDAFCCIPYAQQSFFGKRCTQHLVSLSTRTAYRRLSRSRPAALESWDRSMGSSTNERTIVGGRTRCPSLATGQYAGACFHPPAAVSPHSYRARPLLHDAQQGRCPHRPFPERARGYCLPDCVCKSQRAQQAHPIVPLCDARRLRNRSIVGCLPIVGLCLVPVEDGSMTGQPAWHRNVAPARVQR